MTNIYGTKLVPIIRARVAVQQCILDGELIVWDTLAQQFEPFGKLKTTAKYRAAGSEADDFGENYGKQLCCTILFSLTDMIFDLLFLQNKAVMDLSLQQRVTLLKRCVKPKDKVIEIVEQRPGKTVQNIIDALDTAITNREEGIIIKNMDSKYVPNERKANWIKIKPEYIDNVGDDLDLVILGGYYGTGIGRRGGTISHFLVGVAVTEGPDAGRYY